MSQQLRMILQVKGMLDLDKQPMKAREYDLTGGIPIIEIPRVPLGRGGAADFIIYDSVTSPNGAILVQGSGKAYHGTVDGSELRFEVQQIESDYPFGTIGRDKSDYYLANRQFLAGLSSKL